MKYTANSQAKSSYQLWNLLLLVFCLISLISCNQGNSSSNSSPAPAITSFGIGSTVVSPSGTNIVLNMPFGTDASNLTADFETSAGTTLSVNGLGQTSGITTNDFTSPVTYTATAANGATTTYTVTVIVASNSAKSISVYSLNGVAGVISGTNITVSLPYGTSLSALVATYTTNVLRVTVNGIPQISGVTPNNFTNAATTPLQYVVYAADMSTITYNVSIVILPNTATTITSYSLSSGGRNVAGVIQGTTITVSLPYGSSESNLVATFSTVGSAITVNSLPQVSGVTVNDFSNSATTPVQYVVTAADGVTQTTYNVVVNVASGTANAIISYSINVVNSTTLVTSVIPGTIIGNNITVNLPYGTNESSLVANWTSTANGGESVTVAGVRQINGVTANDFTNAATTPLVYTVVAADGVTTATYNVTVNVSSLTSATLTAFSINGVAGVISGNNIAITLPSSVTNVTNLVATFSTTGSLVTVNGATQVSGVTQNDFTYPVAYVVYPAYGTTTQTYYVTVTVVQGAAASISAYSLGGVAGIITGNNIAITMPYGTIESNLVATFTSAGTVRVSGIVQTSGITANNFTNPVTYTVTSSDGSNVVTYTVTVTVALATQKSITSFTVNGITGVINQGALTINLNLPYGTNLQALSPTFFTTGTSVKVNRVAQISGVTQNNLGAATSYVVTAGDGSTATYQVTANANYLFGGYTPNSISINPSGTFIYVTGGSGPSAVFNFTIDGTNGSLLDTFRTSVAQSNNNLAGGYKVAFDITETLALITDTSARRITQCSVSSDKRTFSCPTAYGSWTNSVYAYSYGAIATQPPSYAYSYVASSLNNFVSVCPTYNVHDSADGGCGNYYNRTQAPTWGLAFTPSGNFLLVASNVSGGGVAICTTNSPGAFPQSSSAPNPLCPSYYSPLFNTPVDIAVSYPNGPSGSGVAFIANAADNNIIACNIFSAITSAGIIGNITNCVNSSAAINGWLSPSGYKGIVASPAGDRVYFVGQNNIIGTCSVSGKVLSNCYAAGTT